MTKNKDKWYAADLLIHFIVIFTLGIAFMQNAFEPAILPFYALAVFIISVVLLGAEILGEKLMGVG